MDAYEMYFPVEAVFVPGCPNIKKDPPPAPPAPPAERKPIKEEIFVEDLPIITQTPVKIKLEPIKYDDSDEDDDKYNDFSSQNVINLPRTKKDSSIGAGTASTPAAPVSASASSAPATKKENELKTESTKSKTEGGGEGVTKAEADVNTAVVKPEKVDGSVVKEEPVDGSENDESTATKKKKKVRKVRPRACDEITMEPKYVCNICTTGFQRISNYTIHMKKRHQVVNDPTPWACPNCSRKYEFEYELRRHMRKYTPIEERKIFPCAHCDRKFQTQVHVNRHIRYVHDNTRPFVCDECGEATHTASALKEHMLTHSDVTPFQCKECGKCFKQNQRLKRHMETHGDKHVCPECGKRLSSRCTLKKHLLVHSEGKPHKCEHCGRAFKLVKTLKVHLNAHTGEKSYPCKYCNKNFTAPSSRRQHIKKKHAELIMDEKPRGYVGRTMATSATATAAASASATDTGADVKNVTGLNSTLHNLQTFAQNADRQNGIAGMNNEHFLFNKLPEAGSNDGYNINDFKLYHNPIDFSSNINPPTASAAINSAASSMYNTNSTVL